MTNQEWGAWGEKFWERVFLDSGLNYVPLCRIDDGGAPRQKGGSEIILPDYEVASSRFTVYVDSKAKRHPVFYQHGKEWRHGIEKRHYENYLVFSSWRRRSCCIAVFECFADECNEQWSGTLLLQTLAKLGTPFNGISTMAGTLFFPRNRFVTVGEVSPAQIIDIWKGHEARPIFKEKIWQVLEIAADEGQQPLLF